MEVLITLASLAGQFEFLLGVLGAALGLGLVIFLHELGHFAVAKWCDVHVERFSIGFGPVLFSWKRGETEYALSAIPFGGYVKMLGQDDADPSQMTSEEIASDPRSYIAKNVWQRMAIISAGVTMNIISAVIFYAVVFGIGREISPPVIGTVLTGMPAWQAGLQRGDIVTHFNGRKVTNYPDVAISVAVSTGPIRLKGKHRDGSEFDVKIEPDTSKTRPQIGIDRSLSLQVLDEPSGKFPPAVPGSAAAQAEPPFQPGDVIQKLGDESVSSFAEFQDRLAARQGEPATVTVKRKSGELAEIKVGANHFRTLGVKMGMGALAAIQSGSPAEAAKLQEGDILAKLNGKDIGTEIDPLRLPDEFALLHGQSVELVVTRLGENGGRGPVTITITPQNRPGWLEQPEQEGEPLAIPAIGAAFYVVPNILQVEPDGPAAKAGIQAPALIDQIELVLPEGAPADPERNRKLVISLDQAEKKDNNWGFAFRRMQDLRQRDVWLTVRQGGQTKRVAVTPAEDPTWAMPTLGLRMQPLEYIEKADGVAGAFRMAYTESRTTVLSTYLTLWNLLFTQRLSYKELHGPLDIAQVAFHSAKAGIVPLLMFLAFLSVNLAVVNFLPIPVLDGGHMVFLIWEAITRRRPSERVLIGAQYAGLVLLLCLMCMVFYLDLSRMFGFGQ